ncbi:hypothetical protein QJS04_geneDACA022834 [Acorus gramineus]|uniref:Uncharacterized protein n=1 Tax=Acorus gramineus TaxID=55184 RepID=A0AAV9BPE8_ACOGR|nr:hypothetical protein QJS04_geneDACA022834 [Acorus gramineus]
MDTENLPIRSSIFFHRLSLQANSTPPEAPTDGFKTKSKKRLSPILRRSADLEIDPESIGVCSFGAKFESMNHGGGLEVAGEGVPGGGARGGEGVTEGEGCRGVVGDGRGDWGDGRGGVVAAERGGGEGRADGVVHRGRVA